MEVCIVSSKKTEKIIVKKQALWIALSIAIPLVLCIMFYVASDNIRNIDVRATFSLIALLSAGGVVMGVLTAIILRGWLKIIPILSVLGCIALFAISVFSVTWSGFGYGFF